MSTISSLRGGVADMMSTLSQVIHSDVVTLGKQTARLQIHADRESRQYFMGTEASKTD